jgi:hypothetical protein
MAEAEKGERRAIRVRVVLSIWSVAAEIDEARLAGMKREPIPRKPLAQNVEHSLCVAEVSERQHSVVGESDKSTSPLETWLRLVLEPLIQHVVQEDVR